MTLFDKPGAGRFCWVDLAATDAGRAQDFYERLLGWTSHAETANGGAFTRFRLSGQDIGSVYQLQGRHIELGAPSHWTPYVQVEALDQVVRRATELGGQVIVRPMLMPGIARVALILDSVGALVGLWEPIEEGAN